jgi:hypothetical protein
VVFFIIVILFSNFQLVIVNKMKNLHRVTQRSTESHRATESLFYTPPWGGRGVDSIVNGSEFQDIIMILFRSVA